MNNNYTEEEKQLAITCWQESGMSQTSWCKQEGINRRTFGNWLKKYNISHSLAQPGHQETSTPSFVSIELPAPPETDQMTLSYPNGVQLHCPPGMSTNQLSQLIRLLD